MQRIVAFYPELAMELRDVCAAILYQQLYYWSDKGTREDGFIYKTKEEIQEETALTRDQQDRARKKLEKLGWLETKLMKANGAPTLHYRCLTKLFPISTKRANGLETKESEQLSDSDGSINQFPISGKPANGLVGNPLMDSRETHDSITEITTEITTKNKNIDTYVSLFNELFKKSFRVTKARNQKLQARLATYSLEEILQALRNLSQSQFHRGDNDRGWAADPDFLIRSDEQVDRWLNQVGKKSPILEAYEEVFRDYPPRT